MVSLSDDSRRSGGYFFNDDHSTIQASDSDDLLLQNHELFAGEKDAPFKHINTTWAILLEMLLFVLLVVAGFVVPVVCAGQKCGTDAVAIIVYAHGALWFVLLLMDYFFRRKHHVSRLYGYLEFFRRTKKIRRVPLLINSGASAVLLILVKVLDKYCNKTPGAACPTLRDENYIQIVITIEVALIIPFLGLYLVRTVRFNRDEACPDVNKDEMLTSFIQSQSQSSDIGFRDENYIEEILEKQADMIRYLKQHNAQLGKRILTLTAENAILKEHN
ncbi:transmembrane protein 192-like [Gigantopelta aegis]|uniref:transmembrane protein 192-like n=1 Tax=Gigantopelta aegis TaxID=1735272 RepID=UPI001B88D8D8|nr:transmembrane protein 192-like [Gigantopelta aegis]